MIENQKIEYINMYKNSKKKDDLADSYLQAMYYIEK